jgi:hypothetical protein
MMLFLCCLNRRIRIVLALTVSGFLVLLSSGLAVASPSTVQLSSDPYTNSTSSHQTEVEPDTFSFGSTIVSAFQVGRFNDGGSSNIGWATSTTSGSSWTRGFLPGTTVFAAPAGTYDRISDPAVAYDAQAKTWLIASLGLTSTSSVQGAAILVSSSTDGSLTWKNPVVVHAANGSENLDKDWIVCDNTTTSPYYGHCYTEWDDDEAGNTIHMSTSTDGGQTWGNQQITQDTATGLGGQPLVQPNGTVIVPIDNADESAVLAFASHDGGQTWGSAVKVADIQNHTVAGNLRSSPLISATIDGSGKVYVVWHDCRFEQNCAANDLVMSTSTDGTTWSAVTRIPTDAVGSGVDHFIPGIGADKTTSGGSAHLMVTYYYYPTANCSSSSCQLEVGYSSSTDGGNSWTTTTRIAGPMSLDWLASTSQGVMVGDYLATAFTDKGATFSAFALASAPTNGTSCDTAGATCHEAMFTTATGLRTIGHANIVTHDPVVATANHREAGNLLTQR